MLKKWSMALLAAGLSLGDAGAQETERMETDRPDQTECPFIVPAGWVQLEAGCTMEKDRQGNYTFVHPTLLSKYGVSRRFELRLITSLLSDRDGTGTTAKTSTGMEPVQLGGKLALLSEKGLRPQTSLIFHIAIPQLASARLQAMHWAPDFICTLQHTLSPRCSLGYNLGAAWDGFSNTPAWIYRVSPGISIGTKGYLYMEAYGFLQKNESASHNIDGGFAYYINNNFKLDISAGKGLSATSPSFYIALGGSVRFPL